MEINANNIRVMSMLGQRGVYGNTLCELANGNPKIVALTSDLAGVSSLSKFKSDFPDRFFDVGIAEQDLVGIAAGLADQGYIPFASTFATFASMRANEFVRHFMSYMKCNIKLVGMASGFAMGMFGTTHYAIEDLAVLRSLPNLEIFSPADGLETAKIVEYAAASPNPTYIRLSGDMRNPIVYQEDYSFEAGKGVVLQEGADCSIFATGSMVAEALKAAKLLQDKGIHAAVINIHTIKPLDTDLIKKYAFGRKVVSIEEHLTIGGLGSAIAEVLSEDFTSQGLLRLGVGQAYEKAGNYAYMLEKHRLKSNYIAEDIEEFLSKGE